MRFAAGTRCHTGHLRSAYTLAELMLLVALAAIVVAIFLDIRRQFTLRGRSIAFISLSADGRRVAAAMMDGSIHVWDTASNDQVAVLRHPGAINRNLFVLSPDGSAVAQIIEWQTSEGLLVSDLRTGKALCTRGKAAWPVTYSADGKHLAYQSHPSQSDPRVIDLEHLDRRETVLTSLPLPPPIGSVCQWFDENGLHQLTLQRKLKTWAADGSQGTVAAVGQPSLSRNVEYYSAVVAPDGQHIAAVRFEPTANGAVDHPAESVIELTDLGNPASATEVLKRSTDSVNPRWVAYLDGGNTLAVLGTEGGLELWDVATTTRKNTLAHASYGSQMVGTPDGRAVAVASPNAIYLLEADKLRSIVDLQPSALNLVFLVLGFLLVLTIWATVWWQRKQQRDLGRDSRRISTGGIER
jgi:WD40 repeat protein